MINEADIKDYFRDLVYIEEDVIGLVKNAHLPEDVKKQILDNAVQKQVVLAQLIHLANTKI